MSPLRVTSHATFLKGDTPPITDILTKEPSGTPLDSPALIENGRAVNRQAIQAIRTDTIDAFIVAVTSSGPCYNHRAMRFVPHLVIALAIIWPTNISRGEVRAVCDDIPVLPDAMLAPYLKSGPYAAGLRLHRTGHDTRAARRLLGAWKQVRAELLAAFGTKGCRSAAISRAINRNLRRLPPLAVAETDRFLPPVVIRDAVARSLCLSGDFSGAARWLMDGALSGDRDSARTAALLYRAAGREDLSRAILPPDGDVQP